MHPIPLPHSGAVRERHRLQALSSYGLLDTPAEPLFDDLAQLAARLCDVPMALISLVDDRRQWFKSVVGLDLRETPRHIAFCAHTIASADLFEVPDALQDPAFADNPLVTGEPHLRFYAGAPLLVEGGHALGALAVLDRVPRRLSPRQRQDLLVLARQVSVLLEERLQRRLGSTLEAIPDPFFTVGADGLVQVANSSLLALLGRPHQDVVGQSLDDMLCRSAFDPGVLERCRAVLQGAPAADFETVDAQGRRFELRCFAAAGGVAVHARDVTQRLQAEREREALEGQLRQAQKMESIGTLAGGIAHDFNNILGSVLGNLSLARDALPAGSPALPALATIESSALRARVLVQQILAFGRQQATQRVPQAVQPLVEETRRMLRSTLPANVSLNVVQPAPHLWAEVDGNQLQQVLLNLCTNAWYALPPLGGRIEIGLDTAPPAPRQVPQGLAAPECGWVHLWVRDNGCGIDADVLPRIFEPFFTTKPVGQGTGLGLSVAHGIVAAHRGCIGVDSARGRGSTFHLHLPRCAALPEAAHELPPRGPVAAAPRSGPWVLCVDDDPVMLLTMQALLERHGCRVTAALSAADAQAEMAREGFAADVLVTDYNMPVMDGLALVVAARRSHPGLPVVLASGFIDGVLRERAMALGVRGLVQKERIAEDLVDAVRAALPPGPEADAPPAAVAVGQAWRARAT